MKPRTWFWIISGVLSAHIAAFILFCDFRPLPKTRFIPRPNFFAREKVITNADTGEKTIYQEFTVSTRLAADGKPPVERAPKK
jgi:hypothetical protein